MTLYVPHASFGALRDWLDAAWRLYYPERIVELQTAYGQPVQPGDPLDLLAPAVCRARAIPVGSRVWVTVEPPVALVVADGAGEYLAKLAIDDRTLQSRPRGEDWLAGGLVASLPDAGVLDGIDGALQPIEMGAAAVMDLRLPLKLRDPQTVHRRSTRARLLLGQQVDGQQVQPDRRAYPFHLDSAMAEGQLSARWRGVLTALTAQRVGAGPP